jgi:acyl-CoA thioesterase FadM
MEQSKEIYFLMHQPSETTYYTGYPRFEGANIGTWIGFKQLYFFLEEALLAYFRERGWGPQYLFQEHGLCLDIVVCRIRLLQPLHIDDVIHANVNVDKRQREGELTLAMQLFVDRAGERQVVLKGTMSVRLLQEPSTHVAQPVPEALAPYVRHEINRNPSSTVTSASCASPHGIQHPDDNIVRSFPSYESTTFVWRWRIPYFYCHYSKHIQHSGYIRLLEEVVDLFLADRGLSIRTMLESHSWIPVVSDVRTAIRERAFMEETIYTLYTVEDILKDVSYTARMDCYVLREGEPLLTATSRIVHGYAEIKGHTAGLARFDAATIAALQGKAR